MSQIKNFSILVVDDEALIRDSLQEVLTEEGYSVTVSKDGQEALNKFKQESFLLVITDLKMPRLDGIKLLEHIKEISPMTEVVIITAYGTIENAVEAMKRGAYHYIVKPFSLDEIKILVKKIYEYQQLRQENISLREELKKFQGFGKLVGKSHSMQVIYDLIKTVADSHSNVLIQGETGTGKELVAQAIHEYSHRSKSPFIKVDCATLPESLMESELFGHERGSFTDATQKRIGRFEQAHKGVIFLDEVTNIPLNIQAKLLRVVQERAFERVGGEKTIWVDVRIISASNIPLEQVVQEGRFRQDLFYRLNVIPINLPPLRERKEDIPLLIDYFIEKYNKLNKKKIKGFNPEAMALVTEYDYPGNVRELENIVEHAVVLGKDDYLKESTLPAYRFKRSGLVSGNAFSEGLSLDDFLERQEKQVILEALEKAGWNRTKAAELLQINRVTLYNKLKKLGLET